MLQDFPKPLTNTSSWSPFASILRSDAGAVLTFPSEGIRWKLQRNSDQLGLSEYGQQVLLRTNDILILTEKHTTAYVAFVADAKTNGIGIMLVGNPHYLSVITSTNYFFCTVGTVPNVSSMESPAMDGNDK